MKELAALVLGLIFVNNYVFARFLGLCPYMGVSRKLGDSVGMGLAVLFVLLLSSVSVWSIQAFVLAPLRLEFLQTLVFILVIATLVQLVEMALMRHSPALYRALGIYLPLITTNCIILAVALINVREENGLVRTVATAVGAGLGFMLALVLMASLRERLDTADVPEALRGEPIAFIVAGLIAVAFMGFTGMM
jgi:electron transport complex protein RnfA